MAGGFTERAAPNRTKVSRTHVDDRQETIVVDLNEMVERGRKKKDLLLIANEVLVGPYLLLVFSPRPPAARYLLSGPQALQVGRVQRNKKQQLQAGSRADRGCSPRGPGRAAALRPNGGHCPSGRLPISPGGRPEDHGLRTRRSHEARPWRRPMAACPSR
jgi:hypothetical protein